MEITAMKCPNCAGSISYNAGQRTVKCPYCDSVLEIKAEPAEIALENTKKEFKNIEHIRHDYAKSVHQWKGRTYIYYGLVYVLTIIAFLLIDQCKDNSGGYDLGMIIIVVLMMSFFAIPFLFSNMVPAAPAEMEEQLRIKGGVGAAVKITAIAVMVALAGVFTAFIIIDAMGL